MKKTKKTLRILSILFLILLIFQLNIYSSITIDTEIEIGTTPAISSSKEITGRLAGTFQVVGSVIAVIALVIIGFRYMFSSLEEKAQLKGVIWYYVVGAVLVFATSNVLAMVYRSFQGLKI